MANAEEQSAVEPREGREFVITRTRAGASAEIFPGAGSDLRFTCRADDTLTLRALPPGTLKKGDKVSVKRGAATVFSGEVKTIANRQGRGGDCTEDVTVAGPWDALSRIVYRQEWGRGVAKFSSSRVILGQKADGTRMSVGEQLQEIVAYAASHDNNAIGAGSIDPALSAKLPLDEVRDMTCADAIRRMLRFFPNCAVYFDYSGGVAALCVAKPGADQTLDGVEILERVRQYDANPVTCVAISVDPVTRIVSGGKEAGYAQVYPAGGDTDSPGCLHVTVPLSPGSAGASYESFKSVTEAIPDDIGSVAWWKEKHPRLANVTANAINITDAARSDSGETTVYPRIAKSTRGEIEAAGLHCRVTRFTCKCSIETADDEEEEIQLSMDFLTTDAETKTYTYQTGSWSVEGETLPDGLAKAVYEQHARALASEQLTVRTGGVLPFRTGWSLDGLVLQEMSVDLDMRTARLSFGPPPCLGVEDMRNLLNGFRQRGYASTAPWRKNAASEDGGDGNAEGGIPPIASSEWAPGRKAKTTLAKSGEFASSAGKITLAAADVDPDGEAKLRTLTIKGGGGANGADKKIKILATEDVEIGRHVTEVEVAPSSKEVKIKFTFSDGTTKEAVLPVGTIAPSGAASGDAVTGMEFFWDAENGNQLKATLQKENGTDGTVSLPLWKQNVAANPAYSDSTHQFTVYDVPGVRTVEDPPSSGDLETVFTATPHSAEHSE